MSSYLRALEMLKEVSITSPHHMFERPVITNGLATQLPVTWGSNLTSIQTLFMVQGPRYICCTVMYSTEVTTEFNWYTVLELMNSPVDAEYQSPEIASLLLLGKSRRILASQLAWKLFALKQTEPQLVEKINLLMNSADETPYVYTAEDRAVLDVLCSHYIKRNFLKAGEHKIHHNC